ncbi:DUF4158 domain-containing protein [Octadecabacter ascidiaceicola]|uniref:DUF4158 domain-containing protein n=1 Tax=Octadecabacter ascidiaceicola TaxID=1655543 RepID=UPI0015C5BB30
MEPVVWRAGFRSGISSRNAHRVGASAGSFSQSRVFSGYAHEIANDQVQYVEEKLGTDVHLYDLQSDAARRHRLDILRNLGFRRANARDRAELHTVLVEECARSGPTIDPLIDFGFSWALLKAISVPSRKIMERAVRSALHAF